MPPLLSGIQAGVHGVYYFRYGRRSIDVDLMAGAGYDMELSIWDGCAHLDRKSVV